MKKESFDSLLGKVKSSKIKIPIQKVVSEKESILNNSKQFSFYIDVDLLKRLKTKALEEDRSIKDIINSSIEDYLSF
ncbi:Ribbon-helix-helix fold protein [Cellulophaga geojensis KL-A]|uniref:Ribbon-helix-helix fold protein n=1 Tax=Cellulophaga geojensis KL-A TaxID=1328323 RepID=A0ABN0RJR3_9FLAO|nr:hypothetical protein [Cellulophaga geojensis]EWH10559.1 Ribbon-helix-helix fold protein [Cellulophaga geojensis KL-A]